MRTSVHDESGPKKKRHVTDFIFSTTDPAGPIHMFSNRKLRTLGTLRLCAVRESMCHHFAADDKCWRQLRARAPNLASLVCGMSEGHGVWVLSR